MYCEECCDEVQVHPIKGVQCTRCNPGYLEDEDLTPLDFSDELFDRIGDHCERKD